MPNSARPAFHYALPVTSLAAARAFYGELLGCSEGRQAVTWVDYDFFGHQLSLHLAIELEGAVEVSVKRVIEGTVEGINVPIPHFGVVLSVDQWQALATRLKNAGTKFIIEPSLRYAGEACQQWTLFLLDPSGNALEFKALTNPTELFSP
jgi:extradiol dioxygenase family protein